MLTHNSLQRLKVLCAAFALVAAAGASQAQVTGSIWEINPATDPDNAADIPATPADVTFTASAINFASGSAYTIGEWLTSDGATVLTGASKLAWIPTHNMGPNVFPVGPR